MCYVLKSTHLYVLRNELILFRFNYLLDTKTKQKSYKELKKHNCSDHFKFNSMRVHYKINLYY